MLGARPVAPAGGRRLGTVRGELAFLFVLLPAATVLVRLADVICVPYGTLRCDAIAGERAVLLALRDEGRGGTDVVGLVQRDLDLEARLRAA